MYKVIKPRGRMASITIQNIDTKAQIMIGTVSLRVKEILTEEGIDLTPPDAILEQWDFTVSDTAGKELGGLAMTMKKPIRDQRKNKTDIKEIKAKTNKEIDAMDVLLGLASYV